MSKSWHGAIKQSNLANNARQYCPGKATRGKTCAPPCSPCNPSSKWCRLIPCSHQQSKQGSKHDIPCSCTKDRQSTWLRSLNSHHGFNPAPTPASMHTLVPAPNTAPRPLAYSPFQACCAAACVPHTTPHHVHSTVHTGLQKRRVRVMTKGTLFFLQCDPPPAAAGILIWVGLHHGCTAATLWCPHQCPATSLDRAATPRLQYTIHLPPTAGPSTTRSPPRSRFARTAVTYQTSHLPSPALWIVCMLPARISCAGTHPSGV